MKKTLLTIVALTLLTATFISCDDKPITAEQLPAAAQSYVKTHYPGCIILLAQKDSELFSTTYEVKLDNGIELSFDSDGVLTDIDD